MKNNSIQFTIYNDICKYTQLFRSSQLQPTVDTENKTDAENIETNADWDKFCIVSSQCVIMVCLHYTNLVAPAPTPVQLS